MKDELLEHQDVQTTVACLNCGWFNAGASKKESICRKCKHRTKQIRSILEAHFSITPEERKGAIDFLKMSIEMGKIQGEPEEDKAHHRLASYIYKIILRALGEGR